MRDSDRIVPWWVSASLTALAQIADLVTQRSDRVVPGLRLLRVPWPAGRPTPTAVRRCRPRPSTPASAVRSRVTSMRSDIIVLRLLASTPAAARSFSSRVTSACNPRAFLPVRRSAFASSPAALSFFPRSVELPLQRARARTRRHLGPAQLFHARFGCVCSRPFALGQRSPIGRFARLCLRKNGPWTVRPFDQRRSYPNSLLATRHALNVAHSELNRAGFTGDGFL